MARATKEPELIDQIFERIEDISAVNDAFLDALWNVLAGDATSFEVIEVLSAGIPEDEAGAEPEPEPEPAPRGRRGRVVEPEPEPEPAPRGRGRPRSEPEPEPAPRGRGRR